MKNNNMSRSIITIGLISSFVMLTSEVFGGAPCTPATGISGKDTDILGAVHAREESLSKCKSHFFTQLGNIQNPESKGIAAQCQPVFQVVDECIKAYGTAGGAAETLTAEMQTFMAIEDAKKTASEANDNFLKRGSVKLTSLSDTNDFMGKKSASVSAAYGPAIAACAAKVKECATTCNADTIVPTDEESKKAKLLATTVQKYCILETSSIMSKAKAEMATALGQASSYNSTSEALKKGLLIGGAAVAGGVILNNIKHDKRDRKKAEERAKEYQNGIVYNSAGERINCLSQDTYASSDCRESLLNYCSKKENVAKAGCGAFNNLYCSEAGASEQYCMGALARNYCRNSAGGALAESPACRWISTRPSSCNGVTESLDCLSSMTPAELDAVCVNFTNDPLCQAYKAGKVVVKPSMASGSAFAVNSTGSTSLSSIVGTSGASTNMWGATSAVLQKACTDKKLENCK